MSPWLALLVVGVVPMIVVTESARRWLFARPSCIVLWGCLIGVALIGAVGFTERLFTPVITGTEVLFATPFLQALSFVVADRAFRLAVGRPVVSYDEARYGRNETGSRRWADRLFWLFGFMGLIVAGVWFCASFHVQFPSRH